MKNWKKAVGIMLAAITLCTAFGAGCAPEAEEKTFMVTIFSDVHHGDNNYNDFACTNGLKKLRQILAETPESDFYVNLGDMVDYLKDGKITFYDEVAEVLHENDLNIYHPEGKDYVEGRRTIYNLMGNHETAYVPKSLLKDYIPYVEGVGSVYSFRYGEILFLCIDANFDRATGSDEASVMRPSTKFVIPDAVLEWAKAEAAAKIDDGVKGIVWLSHIAFKDIENTSRFALVNELNRYGLPLTVFEGHTHVESFDQWYDDDDPEKILVTIYTLPAVTSGETYKYYNVTFAGGTVRQIDKHTDATIELD